VSIKQRILAGYLAWELPRKAEQIMGKSWKTTLAGIGVYVATAAAIIHCLTCTDCGSTFNCIVIALAGTSVGTGLVAAKDHNVTGGTIAQ
jgi:hypothetical protein